MSAVSPAVPPSPPPFDLPLTLGGLLVGTYISTTLFGFTSLQTYNYYSNYPDDRTYLKLLVAALWILELLHTIFICRTYYEMSVDNFGSFGTFLHLPFVLKFSIVWSNSVACSVQAFFANRIRIMSGRWELATVCWVLSAIRYAFSLFATVKEIQVGNQVEFNARFKWVIVLVLAVGAGNDVLIAIGLSFFLQKNRSGIVKSDRIINRLIRYTIQSGLLTSVLAVVMMICYLTMPNNFIWLSIFVFLAKTYSNSFLATLNARKGLRSGIHDASGHSGLMLNTDSGTLHATAGSTTLHNTSNAFRSSKTKHRPIAIEMSNATTISTDDDYGKDRYKRDTSDLAPRKGDYDGTFMSV